MVSLHSSGGEGFVCVPMLRRLRTIARPSGIEHLSSQVGGRNRQYLLGARLCHRRCSVLMARRLGGFPVPGQPSRSRPKPGQEALSPAPAARPQPCHVRWNSLDGPVLTTVAPPIPRGTLSATFTVPGTAPAARRHVTQTRPTALTWRPSGRHERHGDAGPSLCRAPRATAHPRPSTRSSAAESQHHAGLVALASWRGHFPRRHGRPVRRPPALPRCGTRPQLGPTASLAGPPPFRMAPSLCEGATFPTSSFDTGRRALKHRYSPRMALAGGRRGASPILRRRGAQEPPAPTHPSTSRRRRGPAVGPTQAVPAVTPPLRPCGASFADFRTQCGLMRSTDGGTTLRSSTRPLPPPTRLHEHNSNIFRAFFPSAHSTLY